MPSRFPLDSGLNVGNVGNFGNLGNVIRWQMLRSPHRAPEAESP
jgi:hypothetical protein